MPNMSYCRFQNTLEDLEDCQETLDELIESGTCPIESLSKDERKAAERIISIAHNLTCGPYDEWLNTEG